MEETATGLLPDDVVLEIMLLVSNDVATLFRCATTCKRWRRLVAESSFLRRCWPENTCHPSSLIGFFEQQPHGELHCVNVGVPRPLFFLPPPAGSVLGTRRCFIRSILHRAPYGLLDGAEALAAHGGLLLVRLRRTSRTEEIHLAVCDPFAGTCDVLPLLECKHYSISCAILTGMELPCSEGEHQCGTSSSEYPKAFKVVTIATSCNHAKNMECNLYTFSSTEPSWSAPRECFGEVRQDDDSEFWFFEISKSVVSRAVAHWFVSYFSQVDGHGSVQKYYTYDVDTETSDASMTELLFLTDQLAGPIGFHRTQTLSVAVDGSLSLFCLFYKVGADMCRLDIWTRQNGTDTKAWLLVRVVELTLPKGHWKSRCAYMWSGERSGTLLIMDKFKCVHRINVETGTIEEEQFRNGLSMWAVPMEVDWPALFESQLD